jgi:hypothetical protein
MARPVSTLSIRGFPVNKTHHIRSFGRLYLLLGIVALFLSACSSGLTVRSDSDPSADFSQFKTYNYFETMGIESGYNSPVFGEHYRSAITGELSRRGYRKADTPDVLVNVTIRSDDKVSMRSYSRPYMSGGYYGRPGGGYAGSAVGVGVSVGPRLTESTEVSVFIDFVDFEKHQVIWQGVTVVKANDKVAKQLRDAIYTSVNAVFAEYPYIAGQAAPVKK